MANNKIVRYVANTALVAVLAAAGIGAYQLGTRTSEEDTSVLESENFGGGQDAQTEDGAESEDGLFPGNSGTELDEDALEETGTSAVDGISGNDTVTPDSETDTGLSDSGAGSESTELTAETFDSEGVSEEYDDRSADTEDRADAEAAAETSGTSVTNATASLSFSEDTLMQWPVHGNILLDYDMEQTTYFPTLDQYKLSPAIAVQAVEGAQVNASAEGIVYSIEDDEETGTTVTMELGDGYQAIYGQLKDVTVSVGDQVEKGDLIGYISSPTKYYSTEGSNLYFAMKKDGEPVDPIAYLP